MVAETQRVRDLTTTSGATASRRCGVDLAYARQAGVTLIELITVMVIVVILMAVGVPSYQYVTTNNRMATESNLLLGDLQFARSEAVREGQTVTVCIANSGATGCNAAASTWQGGWIVFSDPNDNQTVDAGETILRVQNAFPSTDTFTSSTSTAYAITFNREGFATLGGTSLKITLHDSTSSQSYSRCLEISQAGMMAIQTHSSDATCT